MFVNKQTKRNKLNISVYVYFVMKSIILFRASLFLYLFGGRRSNFLFWNLPFYFFIMTAGALPSKEENSIKNKMQKPKHTIKNAHNHQSADRNKLKSMEGLVLEDQGVMVKKATQKKYHYYEYFCPHIVAVGGEDGVSCDLCG
jgi:hypothetical protein